MPTAAPTPCRKAGCRAACSTPYCADHQAEAKQQANAVRQLYDSRRGHSASRGYGYRWRTHTVPRILRRDKMCKCAGRPACPTCHGRGCRNAAEEVDHIVPRPDGSEDDSNLQGLCHDCHSHKTATEDGGFGRPRAAPTGGG